MQNEKSRHEKTENSKLQALPRYTANSQMSWCLLTGIFSDANKSIQGTMQLYSVHTAADHVVGIL